MELSMQIHQLSEKMEADYIAASGLGVKEAGIRVGMCTKMACEGVDKVEDIEARVIHHLKVYGEVYELIKGGKGGKEEPPKDQSGGEGKKEDMGKELPKKVDDEPEVRGFDDDSVPF